MPKTIPFAGLNFDNRFIRELPGDPEPRNKRRQVMGACYSHVQPTPVKAPRLLAHAPAVAELLDLPPAAVHDPAFTQMLAGNQLADGMQPYASCYGGHQFGQWAGQLGDGRAINLGEVINRQGQRLALQLKGAGPTPYSRNADGLAVLRSSLREFLCSEAMHHLGVPTTRALSLISTGESVVRDMFYNGNPKPEPGAIVCRVAPSFTRFGHFQLPAARDDLDTLRRLVDYTIRTDFPHLGAPSKDVYSAWFAEVCERTADMIVHWQRVGFVHGVMNTDNMSILGLTIDYGPYGWLENYDPNWTPNTTDAGERRYRYANQPPIAYWNLGQLANALYPLLKTAKPLQAGMDRYTQRFVAGWQAMMVAKLGLSGFDASTDDALVTDLLSLLALVETDMTLFFRLLAELPLTAPLAEVSTLLRHFDAAYYVPQQLTPAYCTQLQDWLQRYQLRVQQDGTTDAQRREQMHRVNPLYVLRNYLAQLAIDKAEQGDYSYLADLQQVLTNPYTEQPGKAAFAEKRPDWARERAGCSMLSCSS